MIESFIDLDSGPALEKSIENLETALGAGYSESKLIAEKILEYASSQASLKMTIIRLGQLTGGCLGAWNEREWFPGLVKTSIESRILPDMKGVIICLFFIRDQSFIYPFFEGRFVDICEFCSKSYFENSRFHRDVPSLGKPKPSLMV